MAGAETKVRVGFSTAQGQIQGERARRTIQKLCVQTETVAATLCLRANGLSVFANYPNLPGTRKGELIHVHIK